MKISDGIPSSHSDRPSRTFLDVNSCGTEYLTEFDHTMIREEGRSDYQILYIAKGCCTTEYNGKIMKAPAGNVILYKPYEKQKYTFMAKDKSVLCYVHFTGTECEKLLKGFGLESHITYVGENTKLDKIFVRMEDEYLLKGPFYESVCSGLLLQFLATLGKLAAFHQKAVNVQSEGKLNKVCKYIHSHYKENNDIKFYADMANLSVGRFSHVFKEVIGISPKQYILNAKLDRACQLLETTQLSNADIAAEIGIDDTNYFSRVMKKYKGQTPKHFRK